MACICDRCGKEIIPNVDARYTVADSEDGTRGRHWACHTPIEESMSILRDAMTKADSILTTIQARNFVGTGRYRK
jgi:hypothetical protein